MAINTSQAEDTAQFPPGTVQRTGVTPKGHPYTDGKFLCAGGQRLLIKGVTYGTFAPTPDGHQYPDPGRVAQDFAMMAAHGANTVRTYTLPPPFVLDEAARHGLYVMAGVPWSQHVAFLADRKSRQEIERGIVADVKRMGHHPALLLVALGNEIPAAVVRWHGRDRIEQFLHEVFLSAKSAVPETLFTYVNFPPTEFLDLPFFDVAAFNIYLHRESDLRAYIDRLQLVAGRLPLLIAELGADSIRQGDAGQAALTSMQLETAFRGGACGAIAFAWTDEWWRGGFDVEDWDFGLIDRRRQPKPALAAVTEVFASAPFSGAERATWPKVSVVVCAYNAASTIDECLDSLAALTYPDYEVIVVNDGSRDGTGDLARRHAAVTVIDVPNGGLSAARNVGLQASSGVVVAYTDADVRVDPDWLTFLVQPFLNSDVMAAGGPNVVPADDPWFAQCVARAPGGPTHVLLDDTIAEHVPGCNMAFLKHALLEIGGFNPIYVRAGDDVDVCWRLQARGWQVGFAPAALVWHRHRSTFKDYWRQQRGYGEGEAWLAPHHPHKFPHGHAIWRGRIYSPLPFLRALSKARVNSGTWGLAPFPSVYQGDPDLLNLLPHRLGWMAGAFACVLAGLILGWFGKTDLAWLVSGIGAAALMITVIKCLQFAMASDVSQMSPRPGWTPGASRFFARLTIAWLHLAQPMARAAGRIRGTLAGGRGEAPDPASVPPPLTFSELKKALPLVFGRCVERQYWGELWTEPGVWLSTILRHLRSARVGRALDVDDGWQPMRDLSVGIGRSSWLDLRGLVEDHGSGKRFARLEMRLRFTRFGRLAIGLLTVLLAAGLAFGRIALGTMASWPVLAGIAVAAIVIGRWIWLVTRLVAATDRAVDGGSAECGFEGVELLGRQSPEAADAGL